MYLIFITITTPIVVRINITVFIPRMMTLRETDQPKTKEISKSHTILLYVHLIMDVPNDSWRTRKVYWTFTYQSTPQVKNIFGLNGENSIKFTPYLWARMKRLCWYVSNIEHSCKHPSPVPTKYTFRFDGCISIVSNCANLLFKLER